MEASLGNGKLCKQIFRRIYPRERDIKEAILMQSPVPENMGIVK